ncbi:MAG TPA: tetratricopeptide repeat protein [Thermoanaerobaculia bacterium]|jgi:tetratricopeptide (TPR) repeat protein|nr:tetratricopeptide repeat protein [Thermoanaerobaculia bacterium]
MVPRIAKLMVLLTVLLVVAGLPVYGQSWAGKGRLQGQVKDESGKPVEGAKVTLRNGNEAVDAKKDGPAILTTDKNGKWSILGLTGGGWGVLIEKPGFIPSEGRVSVNEYTVAQPLNITLKVIPKEVIQKAEKESTTGQAKGAIEKGNTLLAQEKYGEARAAYEEGMAKLEDKSLHPAILRAISESYFKEGKTDQAIEALKKALEIAPDDPVTLQLLVNLLVGAGRETEAQTYMAKLPQGTKVDANTLLNLGIKSFNSGKMDEAMAQFTRVVAENPELPDAYYYRALVYMNKNQNKEAKADLQKLLQLDPNSKYAKDAQEFLKSL